MIGELEGKRWSRLLLPDNAPPFAKFRTICPFCAIGLKEDGEEEQDGIVKLIYQPK